MAAPHHGERWHERKNPKRWGTMLGVESLWLCRCSRSGGLTGQGHGYPSSRRAQIVPYGYANHGNAEQRPYCAKIEGSRSVMTYTRQRIDRPLFSSHFDPQSIAAKIASICPNCRSQNRTWQTRTIPCPCRHALSWSIVTSLGRGSPRS